MLIVLLMMLMGFIGSSQKKAGAIVVISNGNRLVGTGFVTPEGVITALHVAERLDTICVLYDNGLWATAHVIESYPDKDYVIMETDFVIDSEELILEKEKDLNIYDTVFTIGHPAAYEYMHYKGYVHKQNEVEYFISFNVSGGISGAPLIGADGKVYGVMTRITRFGVSLANKL